MATVVRAGADPEAGTVAAVRRFNRFYTPLIGLLREGYLDSSFSVTQVRVLYELAHRERATAAEIARDLGLDPAYLSRIFRGFAESGVLQRRRSESDGRERLLRLSKHGRELFGQLDLRSEVGTSRLLTPLSEGDRRRLVVSMAAIERLLGRAPASSAASAPRFRLRGLGPGDLGWVVQRHGLIYAAEFGWDETFEALVARIVADYGEHHDPRRENAWIAELEGVRVGCVFCVRRDDTVSQLRILLVEPFARGGGIGTALVEECIRFAGDAGYRQLMLWTNDILVDARKIYEKAGFRLVEEEAHRSFGHDLVGQNWWLDLVPARN